MVNSKGQWYLRLPYYLEYPIMFSIWFVLTDVTPNSKWQID